MQRGYGKMTAEIALRMLTKGFIMLDNTADMHGLKWLPARNNKIARKRPNKRKRGRKKSKVEWESQPYVCLEHSFSRYIYLEWKS